MREYGLLCLEKFGLVNRLLERGCRWRVGLRENIWVLDDYWLFDKNGISFANPPYISNDVSVADLRLANGEWNKDFLEMLLEPNGVLRILSLPMGHWKMMMN